jgi:small-conductance mechanosensitive channel
LLGSCTATREQEVEGDVNELRSWVNSQTSQLAERTEEDWKKTKEDFKRRTEELDQKQDKFSDRLKADYQQIKEDFRKKEEERSKMAERAPELKQWEQDLLGQYADKSAVNAGNVRLAYRTFMDNVRARQSTWGDEGWEMAKLVFRELNERNDALGEDVSTEDQVSIKALQMEFTALETADDVDNN